MYIFFIRTYFKKLIFLLSIFYFRLFIKMANKDKLDESTLNMLRNVSLQEQSSNPNSKFQTIKQTVTTCDWGSQIDIDLITFKPINNWLWSSKLRDNIFYDIIPFDHGGFKESTIITNCCFFLALTGGLKRKSVTQIKQNNISYEISPLVIMEFIEFMDFQEMVDTDKHQKQLEKLSDCLKDIEIHVYVGQNVTPVLPGKINKATITPMQYKIFGNGKTIIRLFNNGNHFTEIVSSDDEFIRQPISTIDTLIENQKKIENQIKQRPIDVTVKIEMGKSENTEHLKKLLGQLKEINNTYKVMLDDMFRQQDNIKKQIQSVESYFT